MEVTNLNLNMRRKTQGGAERQDRQSSQEHCPIYIKTNNIVKYCDGFHYMVCFAALRRGSTLALCQL